MAARRKRDAAETLVKAVRAAHDAGTPLNLTGGGSKSFYGRAAAGESLDVSRHRGIVSYQPSELVITARAGTLLAEIESALAAQGQMLGFEPPAFGDEATLGGTLACGLSGPARPWQGAVRDAVLGVELINGRGERLRFGGQVIKNVAGYDVSRLVTGSLGTLGVILEASVRVVPRPAHTVTLVRESDAAEAVRLFNAWAGRPYPITAGTWHEGRLYLRLAGARQGVTAARAALAGEDLVDADEFWRDLREQRLPFFAGDAPLWRLSVAPATAPMNLSGTWLLDWGGAQRWLAGEPPAGIVFAAARDAGGHASLFRGGDRTGQVFQPLPPAMSELHRRIKTSFDPKGIFNPGRMYQDL